MTMIFQRGGYGVKGHDEFAYMIISKDRESLKPHCFHVFSLIMHGKPGFFFFFRVRGRHLTPSKGEKCTTKAILGEHFL